MHLHLDIASKSIAAGGMDEQHWRITKAHKKWQTKLDLCQLRPGYSGTTSNIAKTFFHLPETPLPSYSAVDWDVFVAKLAESMESKAEGQYRPRLCCLSVHKANFESSGVHQVHGDYAVPGSDDPTQRRSTSQRRSSDEANQQLSLIHI